MFHLTIFFIKPIGAMDWTKAIHILNVKTRG